MLLTRFLHVATDTGCRMHFQIIALSNHDKAYDLIVTKTDVDKLTFMVHFKNRKDGALQCSATIPLSATWSYLTYETDSLDLTGTGLDVIEKDGKITKIFFSSKREVSVVSKALLTAVEFFDTTTAPVLSADKKSVIYVSFDEAKVPRLRLRLFTQGTTDTWDEITFPWKALYDAVDLSQFDSKDEPKWKSANRITVTDSEVMIYFNEATTTVSKKDLQEAIQ